MTTYYVGAGGNNANAGTSWAARLLTLNGAEDKPVAAGDTVYVGPGVYRELLTVDVSGTNGNPITYIGDVTGEHTDGVGGIVRVTGSDNDTTVARASCVAATTKDYRTFRGFLFDTSGNNGQVMLDTSCTNVIFEDCAFQGVGAAPDSLMYIRGASQASCTIRRCVFVAFAASHIVITHTATVDNTGHVIDDCLFLGPALPNGRAIQITRVGGVTVRHSTIIGAITAIGVTVALSAGQTTTVNNCIIAGNGTALSATATGEITENYNALWCNNTARSNTNTGANSNAYPPLFQPPQMLAGFKLPWNAFALSQWSALRAIAGTSMSADDLYGMTRPATDSKKSWGAIQYQPASRSTTQYQAGAASLKLADAGRVQWVVPVTNTSTTFSVYVYREANYAGTAPQMVIKQPGQSDNTTTDAAAAGQWNQLTATLTPAASPGWVTVEVVSNNTATSGSYATYVDTLTVASPSNGGAMENWESDTVPVPSFTGASSGGGGPVVGSRIIRGLGAL